MELDQRVCIWEVDEMDLLYCGSSALSFLVAIDVDTCFTTV